MLQIIQMQWNKHFNSHAHVERDSPVNFSIFTLVISTHTLTWSVTARRLPVVEEQINFNSHAHVERDTVTHLQRNQYRISTHTLTWSVTVSSLKRLISETISTHTLTWSVTCITVKHCHPVNIISTHTLTWSVTFLQ